MIAGSLLMRLADIIARKAWMLVVPLAVLNAACGVTSNGKPGTDGPTVSISSPASGATVSGTITLTANASDSVGVASVQFDVDGSNLGAADTSTPYSASLNTTSLSNGKHTLTAVATDTSNNKTTSTAVSITVNNGNNTPPTVSITSPASGATVSGTITLTASASDSVGVASVLFEVDGSGLGAAETTAPYSTALNTTTLSNGKHSLAAVATDTLNNKATSAAVSVTVNNTTSPVTVSVISPGSGATVSGTVSVTANATAGAGVATVQFLLDGADLGSVDSSSPYTVSWDTTTASNGAHVLAAKATDKSGNSATSSNVNVTVSQSGPPPPPPAGDDVTISDTSGSGQTNRAVSIPRAFVQGEIADFAQASISGTPLETQCDVKNRWPDGSLKFAVVSFVIPSIPANGSVVVSFSNQGSGNNSGFLAPSDMLSGSYNFDGQIQLTGAASHNISARTILSAAGSCADPGSDPEGSTSFCTYWLKGPIVTAVILEDKNRSFDVNTDGGVGNPLHPIFEAWFYPQNGAVQIGYTLEDIWASTTPSLSARDQTYNATMTIGNSSPAVVYPATGNIKQQIRTRWHRVFWLNHPAPPLAVNNNYQYIATTKFFPNWDPSMVVTATTLSSGPSPMGCTPAGYAKAGGHGLVNTNQSGNFSVGCWPISFDSTGADEAHGPLSTWDIGYLMSQDPNLLTVTTGNADLGNEIPYFYREADAGAGHGQFFDAPINTVKTLGRIISINARTQVSLNDTTTQSCNTNYQTDWINFGGSGQDLSPWGGGELDTTHWGNIAFTAYVSTGQYFYYETQMMQGAYALAGSIGTRACVNSTGNSALRMGSAGYWYVDQERGQDWTARENAISAFIAVDGSPEKAYFEDKLKANVVVWECARGLANDYPAYATACNYGSTARSQDPLGLGSALGSWSLGLPGYVANSPLIPPGQPGAAGSADANFQAGYSAIVVAWIDDYGYCPSKPCSLRAYTANRYLNEALNPSANIYDLGQYVYPTSDSAGKQTGISTWAQDQTFYATKPTSFGVCNVGVDEASAMVSLAAMAEHYYLTASQGGYKGSDAYNAFTKAYTCRNTTGSPKYMIAPRP
jgi:hypothetical protein